MVQTVLYVFGPFLFLASLGLAAVWLAGYAIRNILAPKAQLARGRLAAVEAIEDRYDRLDQLACDLTIAADMNELLRDQLPQRLRDQLDALAADRPERSITRRPRK